MIARPPSARRSIRSALPVHGDSGDLGFAAGLRPRSGRRPWARLLALPARRSSRSPPAAAATTVRAASDGSSRPRAVPRRAATALRDRNRPPSAIARARREPRSPFHLRAMVVVDRIESSQAEHRLRIECERVGLEPVDRGHGNPARPLAGGWPGCGRLRRLRSRRDRRAPMRAARAGCRGRRRRSSPAAAARSARPRSASGVAPGAGDQHLRRAQRAGEIVGGKADPELQARQARASSGFSAPATDRAPARRPDALIEPAEHHQVRLLQPRFEQSPDEDSRMAAIGRAHAAAARANRAAPAPRPRRRSTSARAPGTPAARRASPPPSARRRRATRGRRPARWPRTASCCAKPPRPSGFDSIASIGSNRGRAIAPKRSPLFGEMGIEPGQARRPAAGHEARGRGSAHCRANGRRSSPSPPTSGCFSSASNGTGAKPSAAADAIPSSKVPTGVSDSGRPALSSASTPQRRSSADTRRREHPVRSDQRGRSAGRLQHLAERQRDPLRFRRRHRRTRPRGRPSRRRSAGSRPLHLSLKSAAVIALATALPRTAGDADLPDTGQGSISSRPTPSRSSNSLRWILRVGLLAAPVVVGPERIPFGVRHGVRQAERRQHDLAFGHPRDPVKQGRDGRRGSGNAGGDREPRRRLARPSARPAAAAAGCAGRPGRSRQAPRACAATGR